jgi:hypothetical protein
MSDYTSFPLKVVDGLELGERYRRALRPAETMRDRQGRVRRLPRFFYEIDSRQTAQETRLAPHFSLWEFISVDVRESEALRGFPKFIPCAVALMAAQLELLRMEVGTFVHIAANGGYRSPAHALSRHASPHNWATAINIYRIGDDYLDEQEKIERYSRLSARILPGIWARPYGHNVGYADDHVHLDLGYVTLVPRDAAGEDEQKG